MRYRVTFSKPVTGVTADQFSVTTTGALSGTGITGVIPLNGSSTVYDVTVASGFGSGTLGLVVSGSNIRDGNGHQLSPFQSELVVAGPRFSLLSNMAVGDVNGDGKPDVVVLRSVSTFAYSLDIKINDGTGHFTSTTGTGAATLPSTIALIDLNGDGKLDALLGNGLNVEVRFGDGSGTFAAAIKYAAGPNSFVLAATDVNGDGKTDALVRINGALLVLAGDGSGAFSSPIAATDFGTDTFAIETGDFNGDGNLDVVARSSSNSVYSLRLGKGDGTFESATQIGTGSTIFKGDFNGDGKLDIGNWNRQLAGCFVGQRRWHFCIVADLAGAGDDPVGDGWGFRRRRKDGYRSCGIQQHAVVALSRVDGTLGPAMSLPLSATASTALVHELYGDGKADVIVENANNNFNNEDVLLTGGNPATPVYSIDRAAPSLAIVDADVTLGTDGNNYINASHFKGGAPTLSGIATAGQTVTVTNAGDNSVAGTAVAGADGTWSLGVAGLLDGVTYSYVASAGGASGPAFTFTVDISGPALAIANISPVPSMSKYEVFGTIGVADVGVSIVIKAQNTDLVGTATKCRRCPDGIWSLVNQVASFSPCKVTLSAQATHSAGNTTVTDGIHVVYGRADNASLGSPQLTGVFVLPNGRLTVNIGGTASGTKVWYAGRRPCTAHRTVRTFKGRAPRSS